MKTVAERIKHLRPCEEAVAWAADFTSNTNAWQECERGDWMLWLLGHVSGRPYSSKRRQLVRCACECAALSFKYSKDTRVTKCLEILKLWFDGNVTQQELAMAAAGADEAYRAAAEASWTAGAAAEAARAAAGSAGTAMAAAGAAAGDAGAAMADQKKCLHECANIVRKHYPKPPTCR